MNNSDNEGGASYSGEKSTSSTYTNGSRSKQSQSNQDTNGHFECNICLDTARDAVVSMCGHLFCWPCLHQWLETRSSRKTCPVCKAGISKSKVIPLYGRGNANSQDPREKVPPRPAGQRTEPENSNNFPMFGFGEGTNFQMSFGIGAFPFTLFTSFGNEGRTHNGLSSEHPDDSSLNKVFLVVALGFLLWLMLA